MTERERVLLQREAVREWILSGVPYGTRPTIEGKRLSNTTERHIREMFPLPPVRVPNVATDNGLRKYRVAPNDRLECQSNRTQPWEPFFPPDQEAAIRTVFAHPWVEQPAEENEE